MIQTKIFFKKAITGFLSFLISILIFSLVFVFSFFHYDQAEKNVNKNQSDITYSPSKSDLSVSVLIDIENCPAEFLAEISLEKQKVSLSCRPKSYISTSGETQNSFDANEYEKRIELSKLQFSDIINYLNGVELETPYGLPSPANADITLTKNERVTVYGASLTALLTKEKTPANERMGYYCYALCEVCLKFLKNCDLDYYKFLKNNSKTDISYTEFYDNFKYLKEGIKYTEFSAPNGRFEKGVYYLK